MFWLDLGYFPPSRERETRRNCDKEMDQMFQMQTTIPKDQSSQQGLPGRQNQPAKKCQEYEKKLQVKLKVRFS